MALATTVLASLLAGPQRVPVGRNAPAARDHARLVLDTMRWRAGTTPAGAHR